MRRVLLFSAGSVLLYLVAIFSMFITVPFWSSAKASYALGPLPCFALLAAAGFDLLTKTGLSAQFPLPFSAYGRSPRTFATSRYSVASLILHDDLALAHGRHVLPVCLASEGTTRGKS
jgi:hypothetical protein